MKKNWWEITEEEIDKSISKWIDETSIEDLCDDLGVKPSNRFQVRRNLEYIKYYKKYFTKAELILNSQFLANIMYQAIVRKCDLLLATPRGYGKSTAVKLLKELVFNKYCISAIDFKNYRDIDYIRTGIHGLVIEEAALIPDKELENIMADTPFITRILITTPKKGSFFNKLFLADQNDFGVFERIIFQGKNNKELIKQLSWETYDEEVLGKVT